MEVSGLFIYPVKSLRGIALDTAEVGPRGLRYDRNWMIVDEEGKFRTQRQLPRMAQVTTEVTRDALVLSAAGAGYVEVPLAARTTTIEGTVWNWTGPVDLTDARADRWLSDVLEMPCRLVVTRPEMVRAGWGESPIGFPDGGSILVASEASLENLNSRLEQPVPMDRFRANLVIRGSGAFAEDDWTGCSIGGVELKFAKQCGRCLVTTTDQKTGVRNPEGEPLKTLTEYRRFGNAACFGSFYGPIGTGEIRVGDPVLTFGENP